MSATTQTPPTLHLCIATGQNLANLIPALQCGATEVWILQSEAMRASGSHLADALKARGIKVQRESFDDRDVQTLHAQAATLAERLDGRPVTINLTGGTKLMTLALVQTLAGHLSTGGEHAQPHLVYCDTANKRLDWLAPGPRSEPMRSVLGINDILLAQGYRRVSGSGGDAAWKQRGAEERKPLTRRLGDLARDVPGFLRALNGAANASLDPWQPVQAFKQAPYGKAADFLQAASKQGLVIWKGDQHIEFVSPEAARYLGGGWAEEFAWLKLSGAARAAGSEDLWEPNLQIEHVDTGVRNELDAVMVHGNRMLIVEAKAARTHDAEYWSYKLRQITQQVGGAFAEPVLLSAQEIGEHGLQRAKEYDIKVFAGEDMARFPEFLKKWTTA